MMKSRWKFAFFAFLSMGSIVLVGAIVFLFSPDPFINTFLKSRITEAFREVYPAYSIEIGSIHYSVRENRVGFDSLALTNIDSTMSCTIAGFSFSGIGWLKLLWAHGLTPRGFSTAVLDAQGIVLRFPANQYELQCERLRVSIPDSQVVVEGLTLHPVGDDVQFFSESKFRTTRFHLVVPYARVMGLAFLESLKGKIYRARTAELRDLSIDVLINKDKPAERDTVSPPMPNDIVASLDQIINVDSLIIWNGGLIYGERFTAGSKPAVMTLDSMQVLVRGIDISGNTADTAVILAKGEFMKSAEMNILMSIPLASSGFSMEYSGSLGRMDLDALNPFIERAEGKRFKTGTLQNATFDIKVVDGRAGGSVRAEYKGLTLAAINKRTGSEKGFLNQMSSFIANNIKLRTENMPDKAGAMKIGTVKYMRQRDDPFFRFVWFALRSGVGNVVGF